MEIPAVIGVVSLAVLVTMGVTALICGAFSYARLEEALAKQREHYTRMLVKLQDQNTREYKNTYNEALQQANTDFDNFRERHADLLEQLAISIRNYESETTCE